MAREATADVVIVGAGGGGYPAAFALDRAGRSVVLVDPIGNLGGNCLAEGCIPSKAVREASLIRARSTRAETFGLRGTALDVDWSGVLAHKDRVQRLRYEQHTDELRASTIRFMTATARIDDAERIAIEEADGSTTLVRFHDLVLATGSAPSRLAIAGADLAVTSHELFRLGADLPFPSRPVIIGGGYIGVETASMLANLGAAPTILEATGGLLPGYDAALATGLASLLGQRVQLHVDALVRSITRVGSDYEVSWQHGGDVHVTRGDLVIMATGRHVQLPEGIDALGLAPDRAPTVDAQLRTSHPRVWAPGDVNGRTPLFHAAVRQSLVVAHCIMAGGRSTDAMDFDAVPTTVFTEPEVASVGLTEVEARTRHGDVMVGHYDFAGDARAQILDEREGFLALIAEPHRGTLLGAQVLGVDAAQLIAPLALAIHAGLTVDQLATMAFPHPMASEGIDRAARSLRP
ncbi:pyridine nucleotide-disulphide oxidoreductase dimerization region [Acidimicrobium ferrooxidans DSM 10331]|uniref:Pyridine nucleotide-disulphide oxidoreductase dimerization region n=1 Tax=Acidimicrobium ferrooxidans (strain DSM 10331 / JCM 15462 / NBRC 103882 / ICP) TaxID=525909 RepID=C7M2L8_ACIFD|nr:dihydrolipoyl dehydrogenase [Acidimicrobium ferrooxidans]ACU53262.1 pyridine nucleotide-disulphide oxidoreductase dimerization region [Acidimicrobium ferrooxidans DSM 10331]